MYITSLKLSRVVGWLGVGVVGKTDFNENPVVSLDLDFDLGFVNYKGVGGVNCSTCPYCMLNPAKKGFSFCILFVSELSLTYGPHSILNQEWCLSGLPMLF